KVWRRLTLPKGPQQAVEVHGIFLRPDAHIGVGDLAVVFAPLRIATTYVALGDSPRPRQCVVDGGDLVVENGAVDPVEKNSLLDDRLIVVVQRKAAGFKHARAREIARLDLEHVVAPVSIFIDPLADGIALKGRRFARPIAAVRIDSTRLGILKDQS